MIDLDLDFLRKGLLICYKDSWVPDPSAPHFFMLLLNNLKKNITRYSFGAVSAIITNVALIIALYQTSASKFIVIGSLLIIALADNVSDSLGIHIYRESENVSPKEVWSSTFANFAARLGTSLIFIIIVIFFDVVLAQVLAIIYGLFILTGISFIIARKRRIKPQKVIAEHIFIAILVIILSKWLNSTISKSFLK